MTQELINLRHLPSNPMYASPGDESLTFLFQNLSPNEAANISLEIGVASYDATPIIKLSISN